MEIKSVIGMKSGRCAAKAIDNSGLIGKKIGDTISGSLIGLAGIELEITGGSDTTGFPMRADIQSASRKRILTSTKSVGIKAKEKGDMVRKTVHGNMIGEDIIQVNFKVIKGDAEKLFPVQEKAPETKEEKKK